MIEGISIEVNADEIAAVEKRITFEFRGQNILTVKLIDFCEIIEDVPGEELEICVGVENQTRCETIDVGRKRRRLNQNILIGLSNW